MKTRNTFLHSKLARRIFWLFVLSALIPMTALALISLRNVTAQLHEQSRMLRHRASRDEGMSILGRLGFLKAEIELAAFSIRGSSGKLPTFFSSGSSRTESNFANLFNGLELVTPDGNCQAVLGACNIRTEYSAKEKDALKSGEVILSAIECGRPTPCIFMSRQMDAAQPIGGILVADVDDSYLWGTETLRQDVDLCVLDPHGRVLFSSGESPSTLPAQFEQMNSGEFEWEQNGQKYVANFWSFPLSSSTAAEKWTAVASENAALELAPLARFRISFLLVFLLTLWMVLLLSLIQIRRSLNPLKKLMEVTRSISGGDYQAKVDVGTKDEFGELAESFNSMTSRIEKQMSSLMVVNEIDRAILSSRDLESIVEVLSSRIGELIQNDLVGVCLFEGSGLGQRLMSIYGRGIENTGQTAKVELSAAELRDLADSAQVSVLAGDNGLPSYIKPLKLFGMRSFLRITAFLEAKASAVVILGLASSPIWTEEDKEYGRRLADQFAVAQANSRLFNGLKELNWAAIKALARTIDAKSPWTMGHSERVTEWAIRIAEAMGLPSEELDVIRRGGLLHDIGKIGTPSEILDKPGKLTDEELKVMREHVNIGARILEPIPGLADSMPIVLQHHEWINGGGYPNGLAGEEITLHARIFAVADCFDALSSDRPYRAGLPLKKILQILQEGSGKQFDPHVLEVFRTIVEPGLKKAEPDAVNEIKVEASLSRD